MNRGKPLILVVDDELQNRKLLEVLLRPEGYATLCAASGEEALACIDQRAPDLILLDIMMPGMDGYAVARRLKADSATANIPIIMVSAQTDRGARLASLNAGAEDFLTKPVDRAELWLRVRNLLRLKEMGDLLLNHTAILEKTVAERTAGLQQFRTAMDAAGDAILLVSRSTMQFVELNATACTMFGYTRAELFEHGPALISTGTLEELTGIYDALIAGEKSHELAEAAVRCKDGSTLQVEVHRQAQRLGQDWIVVGVIRDITERKSANQRLHQLANYDVLTGLPNRTLFYETLKRTLEQAAIRNWIVAVLFIDIDHFKKVNDTLGHAVGDELLRRFSHRLVDSVRIRDNVGRLGGDEFAVILVMQDGQQGAGAVAVKLREALRPAFDLDGHEVAVTASIGITVYPIDGNEPEALIKFADTAMCQVKQAGRDSFRFFTAQMNAEMLARLELEAALRKAVENREFVLHYQPTVRLASGRIGGVEALLRWQRPGHGLVYPKDFIQVLEETGLIVRVGSWVIAEACRQIGLWMRSPIGAVQVSVNVSARQFVEGDLHGDIVKALGESEIPPELLELELTESSLIANTTRTIALMQQFKERGIRISIDDFGTGYSSLAYLRRFPIDKLKIDIAFIRDVTTNADAAAIALAIIRMAHSLKLEVIAEGVETAAQLAYLRREGCDHIQGFYFSRALPVAELEQMLREETCLPVFAGAPRGTLLLAVDDAGELESLQRLLRQDAYRILPARSAAEALELLALYPVNVILCDREIPHVGGAALLGRCKELYPDTLRIILSGLAEVAPILEAINQGAINRFCAKPWDGKVLRKTVREAFGPHGLLHEGSAEGAAQRAGAERCGVVPDVVAVAARAPDGPGAGKGGANAQGAVAAG